MDIRSGSALRRGFHDILFISSNVYSVKLWKGWSNISSPHFWIHLFVFLHLLFIGSFLVQLIGRKIKESYSRTRANGPLVDAQNGKVKMQKIEGITYDILYDISKFCCFLLLIIHIARLALIFLFNANKSNCEQATSAVVEVTQSISWIILLVSTVNYPRRNQVKIPWIIRSWFVCSFLQSASNVGFDIIAEITEGTSLKPNLCVNLLSLLGCTFLFVISVRGRTGIIYSSSSTSEPLLQASTEKHTENKRQSPYGNASLLQLITFSWLNPLFAEGKKKPLEKDSIPELDVNDSAEFLSYSFASCLNDVSEKYGLKTSSIYRSMFLFVRKKAAINAMLAVVSAGASYVGPSLINSFVKFLSGERKNGLMDGYILALAFLFAKIVETVTQIHWIFGARQLSMRLRIALISSIYRKGLNLSNQSRQKHTTGEIINHMSVDVQKVSDVIWFANNIWMFPIQISLAITILYKNLGVGGFAGLAATAIVLSCNIPLIKTIKGFQPKIMKSKDERMKATSEVLRNMKILKLYAWDLQYLHKIKDLRKTEYKWLWRARRLQIISSSLFWGTPAFISIITFGTCMLLGIPLTAGRVLSALATFQMLQDPIFGLPDLLSVLSQGKVSADRIASYLLEDEIKLDAVELITRNDTEFEIEIDHGVFSWNPESSYRTIEDIQLKVSRGMKVAICGTVGSGKSSLLSSILGEIPKVAGTIRISGTKAYVPQSPWILSGDVRENITFGKPFDGQKYQQIIQACALEKDFELFPNGDLTEIGERGINMSGGQKQRIQIARAVYQNADIFLLDDPFSAVDAQTGAHLFKECLMRLLKDKTVLYVTHQVEFLPAADLIVVMQNGKIRQHGRFHELLQQNIGFEVLVGAHSQALESVLNAVSSSRVMPIDHGKIVEISYDGLPENENAAVIKCQDIDKQESQQHIFQNDNTKGRLTQDEERETGHVDKEVYWSYLTALKGGALVPVIIIAHTLYQLFQIASNYWMAWASPPSSTTEPIIGINLLLLVYILLSVGSQLCILLRQILIGTVGLLTAQKFFDSMLNCVFHAPMSFYDSTPSGRILNRVSSDQSVLDWEMAGKLGWCVFAIIRIVATVAVMSQVAWPLFIIFIPVTAICIWYYQYYMPTARELARLSGIQRAPILHHFGESLSGVTTIRAFEQKARFSSTNIGLIDNHSRPWFHNISAMQWLCVRLNALENIVFAFSMILLVSLPEGFINPSIGGLAVTYGLNLSTQLATIIWNFCNAENKIISVERILQYMRIPSEAPLLIEDHRPPPNWPEIGTICFKSLEVTYAEHLPSVLKNITCVIPGKKKVGIVGRTGCGKTTLIQTIFRIVEPCQGTIEIDGIDICKIGLHDLRSRLGIIPQDPTMFEGTVRENLDPLKIYSDNRMWEVLDKCQLGDLIRQEDKKLDSTVVENGENWSVGQRQLFCLARSLLKHSSILILDEATASVDSATDHIIQKTIRQEFRDCTVITVAHRINTVIDSDLILVLHDGSILEYDKPSKLLEKEDSSFSKLIKEYSMRSQFNTAAHGAGNKGT